MGYPRDIDEYSDVDLLQELTVRASRRRMGRCDYCDRLRDEGNTGCKFPERHRLAMTIKEAQESGS